MFLIQGFLETAYIGNPFIDKQTGVTTPPKLKLQIMSDQVQKNGSVKKILSNVSADSAVADVFKPFIGKTIRLPVGIMPDGRGGFNCWLSSNDVKPEIVSKP